MKKIKLDLEDLEVDSFDTTEDPERGRGTVFGLDHTQGGWTCDNQGTQCHECISEQVTVCQLQCGGGDNTQYTDGACSCTGDAQSPYCVSLAVGYPLCDTQYNQTCREYWTCGYSGC